MSQLKDIPFTLCTKYGALNLSDLLCAEPSSDDKNIMVVQYKGGNTAIVSTALYNEATQLLSGLTCVNPLKN